MVTRSAEVYPFSKKVAREIRQSQSMPSAIQRSAASELQQLQRGQTTAAAIPQNVLEKVEEGKCLAVVDLISGVGDWGAGVLSEAQRLGLTQQSQEKEQNVRLKYLGFDFREYAVGYCHTRWTALLETMLSQSLGLFAASFRVSQHGSGRSMLSVTRSGLFSQDFMLLFFKRLLTLLPLDCCTLIMKISRL